MPLKLPIPARIPLLHVILSVRLAISVFPMYLYSVQIEHMDRERLKTNEMLPQNTVTRSPADGIFQEAAIRWKLCASCSIHIQKSLTEKCHSNRRLRSLSGEKWHQG